MVAKVDSTVSGADPTWAAPAADLASLAAIAESARENNQIRLVEAENAQFRFDEDSVAVPDGVNVILPDVGSGRWLRLPNTQASADGHGATAITDAFVPGGTGVSSLVFTSFTSTDSAVIDGEAGGIRVKRTSRVFFIGNVQIALPSEGLVSFSLDIFNLTAASVIIPSQLAEFAAVPAKVDSGSIRTMPLTVFGVSAITASDLIELRINIVDNTPAISIVHARFQGVEIGHA